MGIGKWFRKSGEKPAAKPATDIAARRAYSVDRSAFHGAHFRTCSFMRQDGVVTKVYLKASLGPQNKWRVFEVRETRPQADSTDDDSIISRKCEAEGLEFFDAVEHLARFENSATEYKGIPSDPEEKKSLGFEHYQAFARREGILFDINGDPHETKEGEIVTAGDFTKAEEEALKAAYIPLRGKFAAAALGPAELEQILLKGAAYRDGAVDHALEVLSRNVKERKAWEDQLSHIKAFSLQIVQLRMSWTDGVLLGWDMDVKDRSIRFLARHYDYHGMSQISFYQSACKALSGAKSSLAEFDGMLDVLQLRNELNSVHFFLFLSYTQYLMRLLIAANDPASAEKLKTKIQKMRAECGALLQKMGGPELEKSALDTLVLKPVNENCIQFKIDSYIIREERHRLWGKPSQVPCILKEWDQRSREDLVTITYDGSLIPEKILTLFKETQTLEERARKVFDKTAEARRSEVRAALEPFRQPPAPAP